MLVWAGAGRSGSAPADGRGAPAARGVQSTMTERAATSNQRSEPQEIVVDGRATGLVQDIAAGAHRLVSDEPTAAGGTDAGPNPYDLLLAALGSCTSMTLAMYARRKQWPLEAVRVRLRHAKVHAADCEQAETKVGMLDCIERDVELIGPLDSDQRARLLEIANKCPVHRTLTSEIVIRTRLA
jgi:putative redox protein